MAIVMPLLGLLLCPGLAGSSAGLMGGCCLGVTLGVVGTCELGAAIEAAAAGCGLATLPAAARAQPLAALQDRS